MKKTIITLIAIIYANLVLGQTPEWVNESYRERNYPTSEWYVGFAFDKLQSGANASSALEKLKKAAQNEMSEGIVVTIKSTTNINTSSQQRRSANEDSEVITKNYLHAVEMATTATTVKTEVKTHHNPATGEIYAFAAVKRNDLSNYYRKQINVDLNTAEVAVGVSEQLVAAGKKMSAFRKVQEAKQALEKLSSYQALLAAVSTSRDESDLQIERGRDLLLNIENLLIKLEQSTFVYIDCKYEKKGTKDDAFSSDPTIFCDIISQALSENDCSITENKEEADYELTIITSTTQRSDGQGGNLLSYYANVKGSLYNRMTKKKTADFSIIKDPDVYSVGKSPEDAATKAFKLPELKKMVLEKVLPKIKN